MDCSRHAERGQVAPLVAVFMLGVGLACLGLGRLGGAAVEAARARTAADAAALAGAAGGEPAARQLAEANGATLSHFEAAGTDVRAEATTASGATVRARARRGSGTTLRTAGPRAALAPSLRAALARAEQLLGFPIPVIPPAAPWLDLHEGGLAVDVSPAVAARLAGVAGEVGLCRPYPRTHPVHFEACGGGLPAGPPG